MNDQASTLRLMSSAAPTIELELKGLAKQNNQNAKLVQRKRCIAVTGGKGGVGKSNFAVNVAFELAAIGSKVTLLDADFGLANADLLCGISPKFHLGHAVTGIHTLEDVMIDLEDNLRLIPGGSGIEELANFSMSSKPHLVEQLRNIEDTSNFMLIDTSAGIAENVLSVLTSASEVFIVTTPEPTALVDAYATIKVVMRRCPQKAISLVVNNVSGIGDAEQVYQQLNTATRKFLHHEIQFLGAVPYDAQLVEAVCEQTPIVKFAPNSPSSRAFRLIAKNLYAQLNHDVSHPIWVQSFWQALMQSEA